jgi:hypothetical protein
MGEEDQKYLWDIIKKMFENSKNNGAGSDL